MKTRILPLLAILLLATLAHGASYNFSTNLLSGGVVGASSVGSTPGAEYTFSGQEPVSVTLSLTAFGTAATTNGSLTVYLERSVDGTTWETVDAATPGTVCGLALNSLGTSTNTVVDFYDIRGSKKIRLGRRVNTFAGPVSNIVVNANIKVEK